MSNRPVIRLQLATPSRLVAWRKANNYTVTGCARMFGLPRRTWQRQEIKFRTWIGTLLALSMWALDQGAVVEGMPEDLGRRRPNHKFLPKVKAPDTQDQMEAAE